MLLAQQTKCNKKLKLFYRYSNIALQLDDSSLATRDMPLRLSLFVYDWKWNGHIIRLLKAGEAKILLPPNTSCYRFYYLNYRAKKAVDITEERFPVGSTFPNS